METVNHFQVQYDKLLHGPVDFSFQKEVQKNILHPKPIFHLIKMKLKFKYIYKVKKDTLEWKEVAA